MLVWVEILTSAAKIGKGKMRKINEKMRSDFLGYDMGLLVIF